MKTYGFISAVCLMGVVSCAWCHRAQAQFDQLINKVPETANALVLMNVEKVMNSQAATKGRWKEEHRASYSAGLTFLPPDSDSAVLATYFDLEGMRPQWSVAIVSLDHEASLPAIELVTGYKAEQLGEHTIVKLPGEAYLVRFAPRILAAISPANRQSVSRWLRDVEAGQAGHLSPYLTEAVGYADQIGTPIILALDLQDVAAPAEIRETLATTELYREANAEVLDRVATLLASIRGITMGITLESDEPYGKVKVDFGQPVFLSAGEAKSLLVEALARHGAMLNELEEWAPKVTEHTISLEGFLSESGMRRISSLFDRPPAFKHGVALAAKPAPAAEKPQPGEGVTQASATQSSQASPNVSVQASQEYLARVSELIEDLRMKPKKATNYTLGSIALWCDTFARKIDQLPTVGVDPELANYAAYASDSLRAASAAIRDSYARRRARQASTPVPYDYFTYNRTFGYSYGRSIFGPAVMPWGFTATFPVPDYRAYQQARTAISAQERVTGANQARDILAKVDEATGDIRRKMSQKYNAPF